MATSLGVQILLCLTNIFSPKRTWCSSAMLIQSINRNRFLNSTFVTSSHSLLGRRAGWSQLARSHSSSSASCTLHRLFPTNSRSFWACPEKGWRRLRPDVLSKPFDPQSKPIFEERHRRLPTAHYCSCPRWYGRRRCQPAPRAHLQRNQSAERPPQWTACLPVAWRASRCGNGYPPSTLPETAADTATPPYTGERWIKHRNTLLREQWGEETR